MEKPTIFSRNFMQVEETMKAYIEGLRRKNVRQTRVSRQLRHVQRYVILIRLDQIH